MPAKKRDLEAKSTESEDLTLYEVSVDYSVGESHTVEVEPVEVTKQLVDIRMDFIQTLVGVGTDNFAIFIYDYLEEFTKPLNENDDLGYYDWLFHQYLRDAFIKYSVNNLTNIQNKHENFYEIVKFFETNSYDFEKLTWFDVFGYIRDNNSDKNFGRFIMESKNNA